MSSVSTARLWVALASGGTTDYSRFAALSFVPIRLRYHDGPMRAFTRPATDDYRRLAGSRETMIRCGRFCLGRAFSFVLGCHMRAVFAYLLTLSALLGGG